MGFPVEDCKSFNNAQFGYKFVSLELLQTKHEDVSLVYLRMLKVLGFSQFSFRYYYVNSDGNSNNHRVKIDYSIHYIISITIFIKISYILQNITKRNGISLYISKCNYV